MFWYIILGVILWPLLMWAHGWFDKGALKETHTAAIVFVPISILIFWPLALLVAITDFFQWCDKKRGVTR
jgi:hypothetical protein